MTAEEIMKSQLWWKGPEFLLLTGPLPLNPSDGDLLEDDPEVKKTIVTHVAAASTKSEFNLLERISHISDWQRAKRAIAFCVKLKEKMRAHKVKRRSVNTRSKDVKGPQTSVEELQYAENMILKAAQQSAFTEELRCLKNIKYPTKRGASGEVPQPAAEEKQQSLQA